MATFTYEDVLQSLCSKVAEGSKGRLEASRLNPTAHLYDSGYVDSLRATDLITFVHKTYQVKVSEMKLVSSLSSLSALATHIAEEGVASP